MRSKFRIRDAMHSDVNREFRGRPQNDFPWFMLALIVFATIDYFLGNLR
jgi:hypothetical protein